MPPSFIDILWLAAALIVGLLALFPILHLIIFG